MRTTKKLIATLTILFMVSATASDYDIGSGSSYNNGCGYEESCCVPNTMMIGLGILGTAAVIAGVIIWANGDSGHGTHS